jgi:NAD(P)-dependent dehydrogenase (short-subunit alcohol dehydrogenase family)
MLSHAVDVALDRTIAPGYSRLGLALRRRLPGWPPDPPANALDGRHVLVTGTTSGLGTATAEALAALGAHVHVVVRRPEKAAAWQDRGTVWRCDVSDLDDVRRLARELVAELSLSGTRLHAVVHNAGAMPPERTESAQGHELSMATHVLGPVAMTEALLPVLDDGARVVFVTSGGMYAQTLPADDPEYLRDDYSPTTAYARSKRTQVELLPVLNDRWAGIAVHATHPGWADTPGVRESLPTFRRITGPFLRDSAGGADTTVWLVATQPPPPAAGLWHDRRRRPTSLVSRTRPSEEQRRRMWAWVADGTGLA